TTRVDRGLGAEVATQVAAGRVEVAGLMQHRLALLAARMVAHGRGAATRERKIRQYATPLLPDISARKVQTGMRGGPGRDRHGGQSGLRERECIPEVEPCTTSSRVRTSIIIAAAYSAVRPWPSRQ